MLPLQTPTEQVKKTEFTKNINKEFNISANGDVSLANKYGKVDLKTWSQNKVKIDITITVDARNQSNADDIFERIKIILIMVLILFLHRPKLNLPRKAIGATAKVNLGLIMKCICPKVVI